MTELSNYIIIWSILRGFKDIKSVVSVAFPLKTGLRTHLQLRIALDCPELLDACVIIIRSRGGYLAIRGSITALLGKQLDTCIG